MAKITKIINLVFGRFYLKGYYSDGGYTQSVGYGYIDMQIKLYLLRMKCYRVEVI